MNSADLERYFAAALGRARSDLDQRVRPLREKGALPVGGRGRHAPELDSVHFALVLLQLVSHRTQDSLRIGTRAGALRLIAPFGIGEVLGCPAGKPMTLGEALVRLLEDQRIVWRKCLIHKDGRLGTITIEHDGAPLDLVFVEDEPRILESMDERRSQYTSQGSYYFGDTFEIGSAFLKTLALNHLLKKTREEKGGWVRPGETFQRSAAIARGDAFRYVPEESE